MTDVFESLLGSNGKAGLLGNLTAVGDKLGGTSKSWVSVLGPYVGAAPAAGAVPPPSTAAIVPPNQGIFGMSLSAAAAGIAAIALLCYLVIRGR